MDKAEYRAMLDKITSMADAGDYTGVLPYVEEIDWRRVKSVRTLCMVAEIYEANDRLEDSLRIFKIAYKRASISKTVLYRLAEINAKLGNYKEAVTYYREFEEISPMDSSKYILKYEIYRAKGAALEDQIQILEAYKEREYTEQWAYELAKLYSEAGMKDACVETCDDLILWFSEGTYVKRAMELKKKYAPLSLSQSKKYQEMCVQKPVATPKWESQTVDLESMILASTESVLKETEKTETLTKVQPIETAPVPPVAPIDPSRMQNQLADSIRAVFSGISKEPGDFADDEAGTDDVRLYNPMETDMSGYEIKELEPETIDGEDKKEDIQPVIQKQTEDDGQIAGQLSFTDLEQPQEFDLESLIAETTSALAQEVASGEFHMTDEPIESSEDEGLRIVREELRKAEEEAARKAAEEEAARKAAEEEAARKAAEEEAARKAAEEEAARKAAEEEAARKAAEEVARETEKEVRVHEKETDETLGLTREFNFNEELKKTAEIAATARINLSLEDLDITAAFESAVASIGVDEKPKAEQLELFAKEDSTEELTIDKVDLEDLERLLQESMALTAQETDAPDEATFIEEVSAEEEIVEEPSVEEEKTEILSDILEYELQFAKEEQRLKYLTVEPRDLTEKEKEIFSYFTKIPGMSQQITETIADVHNNAGDKTSKSGNFLIIGRQGSGKTKLYEGMVLAICNDLDIKAAKVGKIIGRDLNKKDPASIVAKLSGGFLVIEGAGELNDATVEKLSRAMEFRTDSLVVVLEDEKDDLFAMLDKHPELSEKFTSSIKIPVFTNDELVTFAKTYASENGYKMDEMGVLALYTRIGDNQKDSEPVTVGKVKEIMDEAIDHANKGTRKFGRRFSKNAVDEDNRILLLEKDFD